VVPLVALASASSSNALRRPIRLRLIGTHSTRAEWLVGDSNSPGAGGGDSPAISASPWVVTPDTLLAESPISSGRPLTGHP
jgi:hypothetical protein